MHEVEDIEHSPLSSPFWILFNLSQQKRFDKMVYMGNAEKDAEEEKGF